jgi:hypothetical protein
VQGTLSDGVAWITLARWAPPSSAWVVSMPRDTCQETSDASQ